MTALLSIVAALFIAISLTRFIYNDKTSDLQAALATALAIILITLVNAVYEAGKL